MIAHHAVKSAFVDPANGGDDLPSGGAEEAVCEDGAARGVEDDRDDEHGNDEGEGQQEGHAAYGAKDLAVLRAELEHRGRKAEGKGDADEAGIDRGEAPDTVLIRRDVAREYEVAYQPKKKPTEVAACDRDAAGESAARGGRRGRGRRWRVGHVGGLAGLGGRANWALRGVKLLW